MTIGSILRAAAVGLLSSFVISCGQDGATSANSEQEPQAVSIDPAVTQAYDNSLRCLVWFALEYNAVSRAQPPQPAETIATRQDQFNMYRNAVISLGAQLGKSQEAALEEANARSEARLPEYAAEGSTAYDDDAEFCYLDWQQRVIAGDDTGAASTH